jgi:putative SOS response-associated peptidase YedK
MCGRYAITLPPQALRSFFGFVEQPNFPPRYNIAPTQPVPILRAIATGTGSPERHLTLMRWGFLPQFVKDPKTFPLIINARCETLLDKPAFRAAARRRRCIFIADAFYEWRTETAGTRKFKRPFLLRRRDAAPLALAGLWETWTGPNGEEQDTACIITTAANGATAALHDRLPAVLEEDSLDLWLDPDESLADSAIGLLRPPENDVLDFFEIGPAVNKVDNNGPEIQGPVVPAGSGPPPPEAAAQRPAAAVPTMGSLF